MESQGQDEEFPLLSEEVERGESSKQNTRAAVPDSAHEDETEFDSLLTLHRPSPTIQLIKTVSAKLLPLILFIGTLILFYHSSLNVGQVSSYSTHGGLIGQAFVGLLLVYVPDFYVWQSSIRDRNGRASPAVPFIFLGWILLLVTFCIALSFAK